MAGRTLGRERVGSGLRYAPLFLFGFALLGGWALGIRAGAGAARACTAGLSTGADVTVSGVLLDRLPAQRRETDTGRPGTARARIGRVTLVSGGRRCSVPAVRAYVRLGPERRPAGQSVLVRGVWRRYGDPRLPRPAEGYGWIGGATAEPTGLPAASGLAAWRGRLVDRLQSRLSADHAPVAAALLLADRGGLSPEVRRLFIDAGIVHLLAISGLHVGLIGAALAWLIGLKVRGPRRLAHAAWLVGGYVLLIGAPPSAVRAALIFAGYAFAACRGRPARLGDLAALAALIAILANPLIITDVGFQLSFAGFAGVVLGARTGRRVASRLGSRRLRRAAEALAVSAGAFLATAPLAAFHFDRIVLASIPASLAATGLVALTLPALALTLLLPGPIAGLFAPAAEILLAGLEAIARLFAALPLRWAAPALGPGAWALLGCAVAVVVDRLRRRSGRPAWAIGFVVATLTVAPLVAASRGRGTALVCTLDVGQGDAAVIRTGAGRWIVLDAGPGRGFDGPDGSGRSGPPRDTRFGDAGRDVVVPFLRARGARAVELFALSHPHLDHFGGVAALFDAFPVLRALDPAVAEPSSDYAGFLERAREEGARWLPGLAGDRIEIDDVVLEVLWPSDDEPDDANEGSLVLRVTVDGFRYVTSGDAPAAVEEAVLARVGPEAVAAELLKIGHHGSRTSTSPAWLEAVQPSVAVISAGRGNRYGHPDAVVLDRLASTRARIWRTDRDGNLCIEIREGTWKLLEGV